MRYGLQIVRPADPGKEIDEGGGKVGAIVAQLGGFVIPRENMMVIVPAFTEGPDGDAVTVGGADGATKKKNKKNNVNVRSHLHLHRNRIINHDVSDLR